MLYIAIVPSLAKFAVNNGTSLVSSSRPVYPVSYYLHLVDCLARSFRSNLLVGLVISPLVLLVAIILDFCGWSNLDGISGSLRLLTFKISGRS